MADPIGALRIELAASTAKFLQDLEKAQRSIKGTGKDAETFGEQFAKAGKIAAAGIAAVTAAAAASLGIIAKLTKSYAESGDELAKMKDKTGESVETLSDLREVAGLAGADFGTLQNAYKQLSVNAFEAARGSKEYADIFRMLGIQVKDGNGNLRDTGALMFDLSDRLAAMTNATERTAVANRLLGKSGVENLPWLIQGSAKMQEMRERVRALGYGFTEAAARAGEDFNDRLRDVGIILEGIRNILGEAFLPVLNEVVTAFVDWYIANNQLIKQKVKEWAHAAAESLRDVASVLPDIARNTHELAKDLQSIQSTGLLSGIGKVLKAAWNLFQWFFDAIAASIFYFVIQFMKPFELLPLGVGDAIKEAREVWESEMESWRASMERDAKDLMEAFGMAFKEGGAGAMGGGTPGRGGFLQKGGGPPPTKKPAPISSVLQSGATAFDQHVLDAETARLKALQENIKLSNQELGNMFFLNEKLAQQAESRPLDGLTFDPTKANEQTYAVKALMELMPELTNEEARLLAIHNQRVASGVLEQEKQRHEVATEFIDTLKKEAEVAKSNHDLQTEYYQTDSMLADRAGAARRTALTEQMQTQEIAFFELTEKKRQGLILEEDYQRQLTIIANNGEKARIGIIRQFPTFWESQLQALVNSNSFSISQITTSWTSGIAGAAVRGGQFLKQTWEQTQIAILQSSLNFMIQFLAQEALRYSISLGLMEANKAAELGLITSAEAAKLSIQMSSDAARVASNTAADTAIMTSNAAAAGASVSIWGAAAGALSGIWATIAAGFTALATSLVGIVTAVGTWAMGVLSAIAAALSATVFGIPFAGAILVGVAAIAAALVFSGVIELEHGGIATGPINALIGEGDSDEAVIPLNDRGAAFMAQAMGMRAMDSDRRQEIYVMMNRDVIGRASADWTMRQVYVELGT